MTEPVVDKEAGAEILLRELKVDDSYPRTISFTYYLRVKVYDQRGVESMRSYKIETTEDAKVKDLGARVLQADGSVSELSQQDIYTRTTYDHGDTRYTTRSFAFPGLRPGSIIDFQWREIYEGGASDALFSLSESLPILTSTLMFRPNQCGGVFFNYSRIPEGLVKQKPGWWQVTLHNVFADPDEPFMPPVRSVQPWISMRYGTGKSYFTPEKYWRMRSEAVLEMLKDELSRSGRSVRRQARVLTDGVDDPMEKLRLIYEFCTHQIVNLDSDNSGYSDTDIAKMDYNKGPADTLKLGRGTGSDINFLFLALAKAAGFEVNAANVNNRASIEWDINYLNGRMAPIFVTAVKIGDEWKFFSPGVPFTPFGMISRINEGTVAVLGNSHGEKKAVMVVTPFTPSSQSCLTRRADLTLDEDGTLHGNAVFAYSGHRAIKAKLDYASLTPEARSDLLRDNVRELVPNAEVSNIEFINVTDPDKDPEIRFTISVPGYADKTGERLILVPSVFQKVSRPVFTKDTR
ncbi:MAG TPA: DUF3857 domain-containing protein, partial [Opitutales bacterium]|nr:DUF3857 domain-containing protein [Opitutales bacterium]